MKVRRVFSALRLLTKTKSTHTDVETENFLFGFDDRNTVKEVKYTEFGTFHS